MSDHDFERQVRSKMDELKVRPSASVWQGIEKDLNSHSRRRRYRYLLIPAILLFIATGTYLLYTSAGNEKINYSEIKPATGKTVNAGQRKPVDGQPEAKNASDKVTSAPVTGSTESNPEKDAVQNPNPGNQPITSQSTANNQMNNQSSSFSERNPQSERNLQYKNNEKRLTGQGRDGRKANEILTINKPLEKDIPGIGQSESAKPSKHSIPQYIEYALGNNVALAITGGNQLENSKTIAAVLSLPQAIGKAKTKKDNKLKFGITVSSGLAGINDGGLFDIHRSEVSDISMSSPVVNFNPGTNFNNPGSNIIYKPSAIKPGMFYSAGAYLQKNITKKVSISAGLSYTQYNVSAEVGNRVDSTRTVNNGSRGFSNVDMYYTPGRTENINMRYHYIDMPVSVHYRLFSNKRIPVYLNGGVIISRLVSTNALHFDGSSGVYYSDDNLFNKTQFGLNGGLSVELFKNSKTPVTIGPSFRYQISSLLANDISVSKHLLGGGLDLRWNIKN